MKTRLIIIIIIVAILKSVAGQVHKNYVYKMMDRTGYSIGIDKGVELELNDTISVDIYCVTYLKYKLVGFNELWGVKDIELFITDLNGYVVAKEKNVSGYAQLTFEPVKDGGYKFVMRNAFNSSSTNKTRCRLIIASK